MLSKHEKKVFFPIEIEPYSLEIVEVIQSNKEIINKESINYSPITIRNEHNSIRIAFDDIKFLSVEFTDGKEISPISSFEITSESNFHQKINARISNDQEILCSMQFMVDKITGKLSMAFQNNGLKQLKIKFSENVFEIFRDFPFGIEKTSRSQFFALNSVAVNFADYCLQLCFNNFPEFHFDEISRCLSIRLYKKFFSF
jgi:hypothetical protein